MTVVACFTEKNSNFNVGPAGRYLRVPIINLNCYPMGQIVEVLFWPYHLVHLTDMTSPKKPRNLDSDIRFRKLIENSNEGISLLNKDLNIIYRSRSAMQIDGWQIRAQVKIAMNDLIHLEDLPEVVKQLQVMLEHPGQSVTLEFRSKHADGYFIWLDCTFTNMLNEPDVEAIVCNFKDVSIRKSEEHRLKLLESVITHTQDAVLITEAEPQDEPGRRILYVNEAFTRMTGYLPEEVIGKTPRILQGPKTDQQELKRLSDALKNWQSCEVTLVNYKKNGEEFWVNFSVSPIANDAGSYTHWISIERDVTQNVNSELQKKLRSEIRLIFNEPAGLNEVLYKALEKLVAFGDFCLAEAWLIGTDRKKINLVSKFSKIEEMQCFFKECTEFKSFVKGQGIPGMTWHSKTIQSWYEGDGVEVFVRADAAKKAGLKSVFGLPLVYNNEIIGVLVIGISKERKLENDFGDLFEKLGFRLGTEIKRKQLEQELKQVFNYAPDVICIVGIDGYFKKVNPALSILLEYTEDELLSKPIVKFIHPDEQAKIMIDLEVLNKGNETYYFENRCVTKSGKVRWLGWTSTPVLEEGLVFTVAKDITEKKELEDLLHKATNLAGIGGWDIDLVKGTVYWSDMTKRIHEVAPDYEPSAETAANFYPEGAIRESMIQLISSSIETCTSFDVEIQILTAKRNLKWVRVIGEPEFVHHNCIRIRGSFQDIDVRKRAEISAKNALEERNVILESIGDAFFAVDENWIVTYWNNMAEKVLGKSKEETLNHYLWEVFSDSINSESYRKYHMAVEINQAVHFDDYYEPLNKWYEISAYPSTNGLSVYFKDVTERFNYIKAIEVQNEKLQEVSWMQSHVIRAPLSRIMGLIELVKILEDDDEEKAKALEYILASAAELDQVIKVITEKTNINKPSASA